MRKLGSALVIIGVLLILFKVAGCESEKASFLTDWMTKWGEKAEWGIKGGFILLGLILISCSGRR